MNVYAAVIIAETYGEEELQDPKKEKEYLEAWQLLIDTGMCWQLQGWFGRTAMHMIELGHCKPPPEK
jgi:hypothetical protein